ncbi:MAG: hypothetical protein V1845_03290 [bacterium]
MKKLFAFLILIAAIVGVLFYLSRETADPNRKIEWGVTFSVPFAQKMNIDWKKAFVEILDDLKIRNLRLVAYWPDVEMQKDVYDFSELDWQVEQASQRGTKIILSLGRRLPRWPECHEPDWVKGQGAETMNVELLKYIEQTVSHYKNNQAITTWQVENEPFLNFGECPKIDAGLLDEEIALVRKLDSRPIIMTDSGELSLWYEAAKRGDIFGTTMYRYVWSPIIGAYKYPIPPAFFRVKGRLVRLFVGQEKPFLVIELQGEPWQHKQIYEISTNEQLQNLNFEEFKGIIDYAKETGFSTYYLWGAEWWWSLKQNNHQEYWDYVKNLIIS